MKILIAGASGFIGKELTRFLKEKGHDPFSFDRADPHLHQYPDAIINLAGANVGEKWWTAARKKEILDSRVHTTKILSQIPTSIFIQASAIGFYGDRGAEICKESTSNGTGFLAEVCREWEGALSSEGRKVIFRLGAVLSKRGGILKKVLPMFKLGLGGRFGAGEQYFSWIALEDLLELFLFALKEPIEGVFNAVSPHPVTNRAFTETFSRFSFPIPPFFLRLMVGRERADELLLASTRAVPERLASLGYRFHYPELKNCYTLWA